MIRCKNIQKYYSNKFIKTYVLKGVDLEIQQGEFVTVMGPSGAGKSTLLHILGMLDTASGGEYYINDQPVHTRDDLTLFLETHTLPGDSVTVTIFRDGKTQPIALVVGEN